MKFGGTSVADPEKIKDVARRLVARRERRQPRRRRALGHGRLDRRARPPRLRGLARAQAARARHADLGRRADLLRARRDGDPRPRRTRRSRSPARRPGSSPTPSTAARRSSTSAPRRIHEALDAGRDRARRRLPGRLDRLRHHDPRPRRLRHDRGRARRGARRRGLRDLHRRRGRLHRRPAARARRRASCTRSRYEEMLEMAALGRAGAAGYARSRSRATTNVSSTSARRSRRGRHLDSRGGRTDAREGAHLRDHAHARGDALPRRRHERRRGCSRRSPRPASTWTRSSALVPRSSSRRPRTTGTVASDALDEPRRRLDARDDLGKVSVIGAGMKSHPGVAAKAFETLDRGRDRASRSSTTSPIKIACHVAATDVDERRRRAAPRLRARRPEAERQHA